MANRITKRDNLNAIIDVLNSANRPDLAGVMIHEIELLDKKNANRSNSLTPTQKENAEIKTFILDHLQPDEWYRISEIKEMTPILCECNGTQRASAILSQLLLDGKVEKKIEKRVVYYKLA